MMAVVNSSQKAGHVLVLAFPFGNHANPLLTLVCKLASAAPDVLFSFFNTEKSNASLFSKPKSEAIPDNIKPYNVPDALPKDYVMSGNPLEAVDIFLKQAPEMFKAGINKAVAERSERRISSLITDGFLVFGGEIAESLGIPWFPVWVPLAYTLSAHIYTDLIRQICAEEATANGGNEDWRQHKRLEVIPGLSAMLIADVPDEVLPSESVFANTLSKLGHVFLQPAAVVMNSYEELSSTPLNNDLKSKFRKVLNVGFLSISLPLQPLPASNSDASGCLTWLDEQEASSSVAYISFGTVAAPPPHELISLAEALEESGMPFLWSLRDNIKQLLPDGFVERTNKQGKIVAWAPQAQVLGHASIGLFVTHCGCNSVYESIANGVPMICRPFFGDHRMTGRLIEEVWGIGVSLEGGVFTRSGVLKSFELILANEEGKKMRGKARMLKEVLAEAAGPSGSAVEDFRTLVDLISST
ncbi:anthocyanidin 3-O-glucosyltransferase 7-like [Rosa rugosa]|uniref:anthocyanidin 3-O-glucosyltransferase 7-like n=1 Tax=Rosa rugosa TaxID=74645 RepID=UPI002B41710D|nr:anthocyanidin 3-O-glucosyltransferase 7-like [Rosa rugosa]